MQVMIAHKARFRLARRKDARLLAELVNHAAEGMPLWQALRMPGETAWDVARRVARRKSHFSYRNAVLAEVEGQIAAAMIGYALPALLAPINMAATLPACVPLRELENLAPNTWYVSLLAVYLAYQRRGLGAKFMVLAEAAAEEQGKPGLSAIVSDDNLAAKQFYLACNYRQTATRSMVQDAGAPAGQYWILFTKVL
jgi:ribosomal protein S18 acetylase RimI-like enzyme